MNINYITIQFLIKTPCENIQVPEHGNRDANKMMKTLTDSSNQES